MMGWLLTLIQGAVKKGLIPSCTILFAIWVKTMTTNQWPGVPGGTSFFQTNHIKSWTRVKYFPYIGNNHPNWLIFFRGVGIPPTREKKEQKWITTTGQEVLLTFHPRKFCEDDHQWPACSRGTARRWTKNVWLMKKDLLFPTSWY